MSKPNRTNINSHNSKTQNGLPSFFILSLMKDYIQENASGEFKGLQSKF